MKPSSPETQDIRTWNGPYVNSSEDTWQKASRRRFLERKRRKTQLLVASFACAVSAVLIAAIPLSSRDVPPRTEVHLGPTYVNSISTNFTFSLLNHQH
jgi:hypothetical protein